MLSNYSWIQREILTKLVKNSEQKYTELKPRDVEGNLFSYHLKGLISAKLIEKQDDSYRLTAKGKELASIFSLELSNIRRQPKLVTVVICKNKDNQWLFTKWRRQPNSELISLPYGNVHYGKNAKEMAAIELAEKAGLQAEVNYLASAEILMIKNNETVRHLSAIIFEASNFSEDQSKIRPELGESFWASPESLQKESFVPGFYELTEALRSQKTKGDFFEIKVDIM